ncbi:MAG: dimethyl sulfoxide reductase anchor subunit [Deinococcus-Thermus bacterium]|jgi:DMSO reductase anchor subunit|nr:dimethyl sulfoxide reductase anchor subunit [Deinococcota bacterium]
MHPAPSVIVFTTLSGLGFGLLVFLGVGQPALYGWSAFWGYGAGFALAVAGLLASTLHLGHPERALKAFTQWRTSWLSREAWASVLALSLMGLHAIGPVFFESRFALLGGAGAALCLITVVTTSMIYASIRAVPRWHQAGTPVLFVALSLSGGALLAGKPVAAAALLAVSGLVQLWVWRVGDGALARSGTTIGTGTGLSARGQVRAFEPPHTGTNYLLREMAFVIGRKHAAKLRGIAIALMIAAPLALVVGTGGSLWASWLGALLHLVGVLAQRWLFFAEAEHVMGLYYGHHAA